MAESTGPVLDERSPTTIRKLVGAGGGGRIQNQPWCFQHQDHTWLLPDPLLQGLRGG